MEYFFAMLGFCSVVLVLLCILKIYYDNKESNSYFIEDQKVYEAAWVFVKKDSDKEEVKEILLNCIDFDEDDTDKIISMAEKGRLEKDSGYTEFLKAVNTVLGKNIYNAK